MNNQNPYGQMPQQPMMQQPMVPPPPYQQKRKFFDTEMLGIVGCTTSAIGLFLSLSGAIAGAVGPTYILGLVMQIFSVLFSSGGIVLSLLIGNRNVREGKPRGTITSLGLVLGLTGATLFLFLIFLNGCTTCYYTKINFRWPS